MLTSSYLHKNNVKWTILKRLIRSNNTSFYAVYVSAELTFAFEKSRSERSLRVILFGSVCPCVANPGFNIGVHYVILLHRYQHIPVFLLKNDADFDCDRSPALGGGVVAIDRHFFQSVGAYDPGMLLWGAEQIELSIRVKKNSFNVNFPSKSSSSHAHTRERDDRLHLLFILSHVRHFSDALPEWFGCLLLEPEECCAVMLFANGNLKLDRGLGMSWPADECTSVRAKCYKSTCLPGMTIKAWQFGKIYTKREFKKNRLHCYRCGHAGALWRWYLAPVWPTSFATTCHIASQIRTCFRRTKSGLLTPGWTHTRKSTIGGTHLLISSGRCVHVCVYESTHLVKRLAGECTADWKLKLSFFVQSESPDITERLRLKRSLGCRNFHWFLTTVYPQLYVPQDRTALSGEVTQAHTCTYTHTQRCTKKLSQW